MPETGLLACIVAGILIAAAAAGVSWYLTRRNESRKQMDEIARFLGRHSWLETDLAARTAADPLGYVSAALEAWHQRFQSLKSAEQFLPLLDATRPDVPAVVASRMLQVTRHHLSRAHANVPEAARAYVPIEPIDAYLAYWTGLLDDEGYAGVLENRDRLAGIDEPGFDALLGADLALATYMSDEQPMTALSGALAEAAALVRVNLLKADVVVDRPRLLCAAELASIGFRAVFEIGDSTRTAWIGAARAVIESESFRKADHATIVVAVEQFGFKRGNRLVRPTRLCGYNPPEWRGT